MITNILLLVLLGLIVGAYGTLIGAGGGFILMPILLLLYPDESPEILTAVSLAVVFVNASSGSYAYNRMKRIDIKSGIMFSIATVPGAVLGALTTSYINRTTFNIVFGIIMIISSVYLVIKTFKPGVHNNKKSIHSFIIQLTDTEGNLYNYSYNRLTGILISLFVGYVSSLLGIGGGIIHVPVMVNILNFPVHIATATSHFILAIMALTGTVVHVINGTFSHELIRTAALSAGVLFGAQIGARLSTRIHGKWIITSLAIALLFVGLRIVYLSIQ